jgi:heat shock protein HslJ
MRWASIRGFLGASCKQPREDSMKRWCAIASVALLLVALTAACGDDDEGEPAAAEAPDGRPATAADLESNPWRLKSYSTGSADDLTAASTSAAATATFADSKVSGSTGCNQYNGSYELKGDGAISFGAMASTNAFCEDLADQEQAMLKGFDDARTAEVAGDDLQLLDSSGALVMVFGAD